MEFVRGRAKKIVDFLWGKDRNTGNLKGNK
jgi:hypothetical protein